ncbi:MULTISPECIES: TetR/AcrR family transcriptional regulator [unclassified Nocardiopsis]|uniref:TetR/AcrR family transcriptional regulator n=1 Tax=Nocardiopsis TaxID=2013 RepID=UPI00387AB03D
MSYQRARTAEHKRERAQAFLDAARTVALRDGVHATTLVAIAEEVGLHHSAVRRYFPSRDAVLLRWAAEGWSGWAERITARLAGARVGPRELADVLAETLVADPLLCDLLGNVPLHLERGVDGDELLAFKRTGMAALDDITAAIAEAAPDLGPAGAADLMTATTALAATLWQVCHPAPALAEVYRREPELGHLAADFGSSLRRLVEATARGLAQDGVSPAS